MSLSWSSVDGENLDLKEECHSGSKGEPEGYEKAKECWNQTGTPSLFSDDNMYFLCSFATISSNI